MSEHQIIKVKNGSDVKSVALYYGLPTDELINVLVATFGVYNSTIVGFQTENGTVIPLSMATRNPSIMPTTVMTLMLLSDNKASLPSVSRIGDSDAKTVAPPPAPIVSESSVSSRDNELNEDSLDQLLRFIEGLRARGMINKEDSHLLKELLFEDSTLITAAYAVAVSAKDPEYLAEMCKDLSASLKFAEGRDAIQSQILLCNVCKQLYKMSSITENQLWYLYHLILIRDEVIAQVFDKYMEHEDIQRVASNLYYIARTRPYDDSDSEGSDSSSSEDPRAYGYSSRNNYDDDSQATGTTDPHGVDAQIAPEYTRKTSTSMDSGNSERTPSMSATLQSLVILMLRAKLINSEEAMVLADLVNEEYKYLVGAYELFLHDGDMDDLQDTMMRVAKAELRKKAAYASGSGASNEDSSSSSSSESSSSESESSEESEHEVVKPYVPAHKTASPAKTTASPARANISPSKAINSPSKSGIFDDSHVDGLLQSMGVRNVWSKAGVPNKFIAAVFYAVKNKMYTPSQARALCDLFQAKYDLVLAAWQVFNVQNDVSDLLDTLFRIVRDLHFDKNGDINFDRPNKNAMDSEENSEESESSSSSSSDSDSSETSESDSESESSESQSESEESANEDEEEDEDVLRAKAKRAVDSAKSDLLSHTLEIMVKQNLLTRDKALALYQRGLNGDVLIDTAIKAYAKDRSVVEFLDALQILGNHTSAEIERMIHNNRNQTDSQEEDEDEEEEDEESDESESEEEEEDEEEEDERFPTSTSASQYDKKQQYLRDLITELYEHEFVDKDTAVTLLYLNSVKDAKIVRVLDNYAKDSDAERLIESLVTLGNTEKVRIQRMLQQDAPNDSQEDSEEDSEEESDENEESRGETQEDEEDESDSDNERNAREEVDSGIEMRSFKESNTMVSPPKPATVNTSTSTGSGDGSILDSGDQSNIVEIIVNAGTITKEHGVLLNTKIKNRDPVVTEAFRLYEADHDVYRLIGVLRGIAANHQHASPAKTTTSTATGSATKANVGPSPSKAPVAAPTQSSPAKSPASASNANIEQKFLQIVQNMTLSSVETAALRLAIARGDSSIRTSLEAFKSNTNEEILVQTLRNIAKNTIAATIAEQEKKEAAARGTNDEDEDDDDEEDDEEDDEDEDDEDDDEEEEEEEDSEDEVKANTDANARSSAGNKSNILSTQNARGQIFPILLSELSKEGILGKQHCDRLYSLFQSNNVVIAAALDVYDLDNDMGELVDTLQRIAVLN